MCEISELIYDPFCAIILGVLWLGPTVLPKAPELVKKLRAVGKKVFFMTNNSTKTREEFMKKFNNLGFEATMVSPWFFGLLECT